MTAVILRRLNWESRSAEGIISHMRNPVITLQTGDVYPDNANLLFRWGCTANSPVRSVVNKAEAIHRVSNKSNFRRLLSEHMNAHTPESMFEYLPWDLDFENGVKYIVRPKEHERGHNFHVVDNLDAFNEAVFNCGRGWYAQKVINKQAEYRVMMAQGRVVFIIEKRPNNPNLIAWGRAAGWNTIRWDDWPLRAARIAREAFCLSELHLGAVDVIVDPEGSPYVCEINSAPELAGDYEMSRVAKVMDYIIENGKDPIPIIQERGGWRKFIHPAISNRAILVD